MLGLYLLLLAQGIDFAPRTIATGLKGGYQVVAADMDRDGDRDLIALASGLEELAWYENPSWERHVITRGLTQPINVAVWGDHMVVADRFSSKPSKSEGTVWALTRPTDPRAEWKRKEIDRLTTSHRLKVLCPWGPQRCIFVNSALAGTKDDYSERAPIVYYEPGKWKRRVLYPGDSVVTHGIAVVPGKSEQLLVASSEGIGALRPVRSKKTIQFRMTRWVSVRGKPTTTTGASDVTLGRFLKQRMLAAIEPWHGNFLVTYLQRPKNQWQRVLLDDTYAEGHTVLTHDFDNDGRDEVVAGYRQKGGGLFLYRADDETGERWSRRVIDGKEMATSSCVAEDFDGDGKKDLACIGAATANLRLYLRQ
ncbi:MAG: VCBS repeat-containing protein [Bryobacter sp.]|nr:VCBS repeat-containing protein [Bryobacter sp.]